MANKNKKWLRMVMLVASCILLLSVIIPHHHHEGGVPCIFFMCNHDDNENEQEHSCDCEGHTLAYYVQQNVAPEAVNPIRILMPLYTLFDLTYSPQIILPFTVSGSNRPIYAESLYDVWIPASAGLRAPPSC